MRFDDATAVWARIGNDFDDGICNLAKEAKTTNQQLVALLRMEGRHEAEEGKGGVGRYWLEWVLALSVLAGIGLAIVELRDQPHPLTGLRDAATRSFIGPNALAFSVAEFDTETHAQEGMAALAQQLVAEPLAPGDLDLSQLEEVSAPEIRDGAQAYWGRVPLGDATADIGFLLVHDGRYVYVMQSLSAGGDAISPVSLAERLFGPGPYLGLAATPGSSPSTDRPYQTGGLWDRLPRPEHLPRGYTVADEADELNATLFGSAG